MFKKIKEKEAYKKYIELRSNPQTKAIMSLGLWLLFFIIIVIFTRGINSNRVPNYSKSIDKIISSYEYTYQNNKMTIFGRFYNGKQVFSILNSKYYYNGENVYLVNGNALEKVSNFDMNILKITVDFVDKLTNNLSFSENGNVKQYIVPLVNFINLYEIDTAIDLSFANNYNIIIQKFFNDDDLYKIEVDLTNYYNINNINDDGKLIIDLYNKNQIGDFTFDYDRVLGVRK